VTLPHEFEVANASLGRPRQPRAAYRLRRVLRRDGKNALRCPCAERSLRQAKKRLLAAASSSAQ